MAAEQRSPTGSIATVVIAVLLAAEIARLSIASALAGTGSDWPETLAPAAPSTLAPQSMQQVAEGAVRGQEPSAATMENLRRLAGAAPLEPEPFLVEAALAERRGDLARAERLLLKAEARDPRSAAAHYLLGDVRMRQGNVLEALRELAIIARVVPGASLQLVGGLAQYARTPGALPGLSRLVAENPQLKAPLLNALAADPSNADLIIHLYRVGPRGSKADTSGWQSRLLEGLVQRGNYDAAYGYWRMFAGADAAERPLLFNGDFSSMDAPPPFNWTLASGAAGVAEPNAGKLRVLAYGREEAPLASQLLLLPPGTYRFEAGTSAGIAPDALGWTLACAKGGSPLMSIAATSTSASRATFTIPADCRAQRLQLVGHLQDMPRDTDAMIGPVSVTRAGS